MFLSTKLENASKQGPLLSLPPSAGEKNITMLHFLQSYSRAMLESLEGWIRPADRMLETPALQHQMNILSSVVV